MTKPRHSGSNEDLRRSAPDEAVCSPLVDSSELFGKGNEILIRHQGTIYRLRITRNDKLIMNK